MLKLLLIFAVVFTMAQTLSYAIGSYDKSDDLFFDMYIISATVGFLADVIYLFYKYITA